MRILLVDDGRLFRRLVRFILLADQEIEVAAEVSEGLEAVQRAAELKPDVVLLDIDLPDINGIETARRIRQSSACSKIVFLTHHLSLAILHEALAVGGHGYVVKSRASEELIPAIEAVRKGERFVSKALRTDTGNA